MIPKQLGLISLSLSPHILNISKHGHFQYFYLCIYKKNLSIINICNSTPQILFTYIDWLSQCSKQNHRLYNK